ncbi:hypothetical protein ACYSNM_10850 [Myroides sp. LJL116]
MKSKTLKFCIGVLLVVGISILLWESCFKQTHNSVIVTLEDGLSIEKVEIQRVSHSINSTSDQKLFTKGLKDKVFINGKAEVFEKKVGENDFLVVYDNSYYTIFRHFILNDYYNGIPGGHTYHFTLSRSSDTFLLKVDIEGEFENYFELEMIPVELAPYSIWTKTIEVEQINL